MTDLFLQTVNLSYRVSFLILAILLLRLVLKKAPKWISVALWGIAAVRLLLPFSLESIFSMVPSRDLVTPEIMLDPTPTIQSGIPVVNDVINPIIQQSFAPNPGTSMNPLQLWIPVAAILWLAGFAAMVLYTLISYWRLKRTVSDGVEVRAGIYRSRNVPSPFVLGLLRPRIYLPEGISKDDEPFVIAHEEAHIRRRDHWWKPFGFLLLSIHWFNPLMWLGYIFLCRDIELACDEKVIDALGEEVKADYSQALLNCSVSRKRIAACPLAFGEVGVKQRIKSVLHYKKPAFWILIAAIIISIIAAVCFLTDPVKTSPENPSTAPTASTTAPTKPTDPSTISTDPSAESTAPPTEPTEPPTEPPTQPTEPPTEPTEPPTEPTEPPTEPTEPPTEPTEPPTEPTEPPTEPTEPPTEPTEPPTEPTEPPTEPTEPPTEPTEPPTEPTEPPTQPTEPPTQPTEPPTEPTEPPTEPTEPPTEPVDNNKYTITFRRGSTLLSKQILKKGAKIYVPAAPEGCWYTWNQAVPETMPAEDLEIIAIAISGQAGYACTWEYDFNGCLTIDGQYGMSNYKNGEQPWYKYRFEITTLRIGENITSLGRYAFYECENLTEVIIPDSVRTIGSYCFVWCSNIQRIVFGKSLTNIGENAFSSVHFLLNQVSFRGATTWYAKQGNHTYLLNFTTNIHKNATIFMEYGECAFSTIDNNWPYI